MKVHVTYRNGNTEDFVNVTSVKSFTGSSNPIITIKGRGATASIRANKIKEIEIKA